MKTRILLTLLGFTCCVSLAVGGCDLSGRKSVEVEFPDILKYVGDSYIMGVEYSTPKASETSYFTEYYEVLFKRGRIESHIKNSNSVYIYRSETGESWTIENGKCQFRNLSATPEFFKSDQTDWVHFTGGEDPTTVGPSAMLKTAYDVWNNTANRKDIMAYMGPADDLVRGERAVYWRRCTDDKEFYVDYYFADQKEENAFDTDLYKKTITPLRVSFYGVSKSEMKELSEQHYDILSFQHYIPAGVEPFQLPMGKNCSRSLIVEGPKLPNFASSNLFINAEVVYKKYLSGSDEPMGTYYSTFRFALDRQINYMAYYYSSWDKTKHVEDSDEPLVKTPTYIIYDMNHAYSFNISTQAGTCEIARRKTYVPLYTFPKEAGSLDLTNAYALLPNDELSYLTSGTVRGMEVNIYEASVDNFFMGNNELGPKALITHSYLKSNEKLETASEVAGALVQIDIRLFRKEHEELITFNLFGFSTKIPMKQRVFDVTKCFRNDDDYSILTIGFEVESQYIPYLPKALPEIEESVIATITGESELNTVRIPVSMSSIKEGYAFVTLIILDKPDPQLDFIESEQDKTITVTDPVTDTDGVANFKICANKCVERRSDCWGFALCGDATTGTCYFGSDKNTNVETKKNCILYKKFNSTSSMQSKELQVENLRNMIDANELMISAQFGDERIQLVATYSRVDDPAKDDDLFKNIKNDLNPRLTVQKPATKLKKGTEVKNMGRLTYDECQTLCLDFKACETLSFCLKNSACVVSTKSGSDLKADEIEADDFCVLLTRKAADHFENTPGISVKGSGGSNREASNVEDCARACLKETGFTCLSFDHCVGGAKDGCTIYSTHYLSKKEKADGTEKSARCGHYSKKFSNEFTRKDNTRILGSTIPLIFNLTLEECAKTCVDYGEGTCYGYDFCQDATLYHTSCTIFDSDPSRLESVNSKTCTNYIRTEGVYAPRPFTNGYAGGIGFVCFVVGGILGAVAIFVYAYIRVNKRG